MSWVSTRRILLSARKFIQWGKEPIFSFFFVVDWWKHKRERMRGVTVLLLLPLFCHSTFPGKANCCVSEEKQTSSTMWERRASAIHLWMDNDLKRLGENSGKRKGFSRVDEDWVFVDIFYVDVLYCTHCVPLFVSQREKKIKQIYVQLDA